MDTGNTDKNSKPSLPLKDIASAAFGVKGSGEREQRFQPGQFPKYVIGSVIFVALFIASVTSVV
ncbi:MAG: DUF2970 domain-containing protein, partial [Spongiibacteraceae bacterium]